MGQVARDRLRGCQDRVLVIDCFLDLQCFNPYARFVFFLYHSIVCIVFYLYIC